MSSKVKIYTRTGDRGQTSLYGGKRVSKDNLQVSAYGTVDELNSSIGVVISHIESESEIKSFLVLIQADLFTIGARLAGSKVNLENIKNRVKEMEKIIDRLDENLPELRNFILPGGSQVASFSHLARSVCRRAERDVVSLKRELKELDDEIIIYLNRLSDLLFVLARYLNKMSNVNDIVWKGK